MKTLLIDATFVKSGNTGIERYFLEITKRLLNDERFKICLLTYKDSKIELKSDRVITTRFKKRIYDFITLFFPINLNKLIRQNFDAYIFFNFKSYKTSGKSIAVIHDLGYKRGLGLKGKKAILLRRKIKLSMKFSHLVTVSNSVKREILEDYTNREISVVSPAGFKSISENIIKNKNYFLTVGTLNSRKNNIYLVNEFKKFKEEEASLTIVGGLGDQYSELIRLSSSDKRIKILTNVDDEQLIELYKISNYFVSASVYEGFGIPILEAKNYGCNIICSNIASYREILGEDAIYFDLKEGNLSRLLNNIYKAKKSESSVIDKYSWEESSKKFSDIIINLK